jgi:hypothetical protein
MGDRKIIGSLFCLRRNCARNRTAIRMAIRTRVHCKKRGCRFDLQRAIGGYVADKCSFLCIVLDIHRTETR